VCIHTLLYIHVGMYMCMTAISVCWLLSSNKVVISYYSRGVDDYGPMMEEHHGPAKQ
jgi:hypothetical protein